jgi:HEAT repeat protein
MILRSRFATVAAAALAVLLFGACEKDPHDADTWIDKLDTRDRTELNEALRHLDRLKDPKAIGPLGKSWEKHNRDSQIMRTMITVAAYQDPKTGKGPNWKDAVPYLLKAVEDYDAGDPRSVEDASVACNALGRAAAAGQADDTVLTALINTANKQLPRSSPENRVRINAVSALGKFKDKRAVDVLIRILEGDPEKQLLRLNAAAALAVAETGDPKALPALTKALFLGPLYKQVRAGITRVGKPAVEAMIKLYQEKDDTIQAYAKEKDFAKKAPGNVPYKGALLLGDLRAPEAIPLLLAGLKAEPRISFFDEKTGAAGPSTHEAIFDALKRSAIGNKDASDALREYWKNPKTDDFVRPMAIDAYSVVTKETSELDTLYKLLSDENQEDQIRAASALAYGRLGRTADHQKKLDGLVARYEERVKQAEEKAKKAKNDEDKAAAEAERDRATLWKNTLQESAYRLQAGVQCGDDPKCYVDLLGKKDVAIGQPGLPKAERALFELAKMGEKARPVQDDLLKYVDSREHIVREGVLLALPRVVALPCDKCATRMAEVMERQASEQTLDDLNHETRIVYHYFLWAGK